VEPSGLLERDEILARVRWLLEEVVAGRPAALFVRGDAGLGKTSLIDQACRLAADLGMTTGRGRGHPLETTLPFGLLTQALGEIGGSGLLSDAVPPEASAPASAAAAVRVGAKRAVEVPAAHGLAETRLRGETAVPQPTSDRAARFYGVLRWLMERSGSGGMLLAVDDLHWADADSLALLSFLARRSDSMPLGIIGCLRPWPAPASEAAVELASENRGQLHQLAPLSEAASGTLLEQRVGHEVPPAVTHRAFQLCAGNPLLLAQLAVAIGRGEDLPSSAPLTSSGFGSGLLLARFAGLPLAGMRCAQAASILGPSFLPDIAAQIAGLDGPDADAAFEALGRTGLIGQGSGAEAEFVHPLFRRALYQDLAGPLRTSLHGKAFRILVGRGLEAQAAEHAVRAGLTGDPQAVAVLTRAAQTARRTGALAAAATRFDEAVTMAADRADPDLLLAQAEAHLATGHADRAIAEFIGVLDRTDLTPDDRVTATWLLARSRVAAGQPEAAAARFQAAAGLATGRDPGRAVEILLEASISGLLSGGPARALPMAAEARNLAVKAGGDLQVRADASWGQSALFSGDPEGMAAAELAAPWRLDGDPSRPISGWGSINVFAYCARLVERFDEAHRAFEIARSQADRAGVPAAIATLAVGHSYNLVRMGRLDEGLAAIDVALGLADLVPQVESFAGVGRAYISLYQGRLDESATWCQRVESRAVPRGERIALLFLWDVLGHRSLRAGGAATASDYYLRLETEVAELGIGEPCLPPWARHAIAAHLAAGRPDDAVRVIGWLEGAAARLPCSYPRIAVASGRAQLAELAGDEAAAHEGYRMALALHERADMPIERTETLLGYGGFLRRSGQRAKARTVLAQAVHIATAAGAGWLAGLAAAELKAAGGRRRTHDPAALSAAERRVARLAAVGAGNAEISRQLFITVSTVETHLEHVYRKLGIGSRYQLIAMAADPRLDDADQGASDPVTGEMRRGDRAGDRSG
jgi:DNA-binding CsgD family transcriptional regulator